MAPSNGHPQVERLAGDLRTLVEGSSTLHPLKELHQQGIARVRLVSESALQNTIRAAVNHALQQELEGIDLPRAALDQIQERAYRRFVELSGGRTVAEDKTAAAADTAPPKPLLDEKRRARIEAFEAAEAARMEKERARGQKFADAELEALEKRMAAHLGEILSEDVNRRLEAVHDSHRRQVQVLEERIAKLARAIESTDRVLARVSVPGAAAESAEDPAASLPHLKGLDPGSPLFERKSQLLEALFKANVALQELKSGAGSSDDVT